MSIKHTSTISLEQGGVILSQSVEMTGTGEVNVDESIPNDSTDLEITFLIDQSAMVSLYIESDQNILIETNSGGAPTDSITIVANEPIIWTTNSVHSNPITADVTANIFVTKGSGSPANLKIRALQDVTP